MPACLSRLLAEARWPEPGDPVEPPPIAGFVASTFSPLVAAVAERCLSRAGAIPLGTAIVLVTARGDLASARAVAEAVGAGRRISPLMFFQSVPNAVLGHVAARHGLDGPLICISPCTGDPLAEGLAETEHPALVIVADQDPDRAHAVLVQALPTGPDSRGGHHARRATRPNRATRAADQARRAVNAATVTGIGLITPAGSSADALFDALCAGRSGLRRPPPGHPLHGVVEAAGIAPPIDPATVVPAPEVRTVDRYIVLALTAADAAIADAGLVPGGNVDPHRVATVISGTGGLGTLADQAVAREERGRFAVSPYLLPGMLPNMGAARVAIRHGLRGYSTSHGTACAAGAQAIGEALRLIRGGDADVVVCGSAEAPLFATLADTFGNARALARGWDDPAEACRPFDRRRNGFVLGEGAGVLVVERAEFAAARGAAGYADLLGWGMTTDAHHPTTPRPDGESAAASITAALRDAGIEAGDVGYLNAHGTGTKLGDAAEALAIRRAGIVAPVSSSKAVTGHLLGASGAVEAAATIVALRRGSLPPTHNLDDPDPACDLDHIRRRPRPAAVACALSTSFGFGGHNVSLAFGPPGTTRLRPV